MVAKPQFFATRAGEGLRRNQIVWILEQVARARKTRHVLPDDIGTEFGTPCLK
jgi:hypothetical protein